MTDEFTSSGSVPAPPVTADLPFRDGTEVNNDNQLSEETPQPVPTSQPLISQSPPVSEAPLPASPVVESESKLDLIKKIFPLLILVLFLVAGLWLVFKKVLPKLSKTSKSITLTYWGLWEPNEALNGIIMDWEKDHPEIKISYSQQSIKEYRERLQSALARKEGPDIFRYHLTWLPMFKNDLEPIPSTVLSSSQFESAYYPVAAKFLRLGTNYYGLPLMVDSLALFYNEDLFQAAGKTPPTSWEELRQLALDLTVKDEQGKIQVAGVALGITNNVDHWSDILGLMMLQNGVDLTNPAACQQQAGEEVCLGEDALSYYTLFSQVDKVWDATLPGSTLAFASGKLAMYLAPSWRVFDLKAINPQLNFKIVPVPQLPGLTINWASFWVEGVAKNSNHQTEAWEFLKYLSSPQTLEKLYSAQSNLRLFGEIYPRQEMAEKIITNPLVEPFVSQMKTAQTWYLCSRTWDNGINDRIIKYFEDAVNAVNQGKKAKEALATASQGITQILTQYGLSSRVTR